MHEVAPVVAQVRVERPPLATVLGLAVKLIVGTGALTDTTLDCAALPPGPLQVNVKVDFEVRAPVDCEPLVALVPDHAPEAAHEVAWIVDQVRVAL